MKTRVERSLQVRHDDYISICTYEPKRGRNLTLSGISGSVSKIGSTMKMFENNSEITITCTECGAPVSPESALLVDMEHADGTVEVAVFHSGHDKMCPLKWAAKKIDEAGAKLQKILEILDGTILNLRQSEVEK